MSNFRTSSGRSGPSVAADESESSNTNGNVHVEHPAPGGVLHDGAPYERACHNRDAEDTRESANHPCPGFGRKDYSDNCNPYWEKSTTAESLDSAEQDEFGEVLADTRKNRTYDEHSESTEEDVPSAPEVRELCKDRNARGGSDDVCADDKSTAVRLTKLDQDYWKRGERDEIVERAHQEGKQDPYGDQQFKPRGQSGWRSVSGKASRVSGRRIPEICQRLSHSPSDTRKLEVPQTPFSSITVTNISYANRKEMHIRFDVDFHTYRDIIDV